MMATGILIGLGQKDAVAPDMIDRSDMLAIETDHFLMVMDLSQRLPLGLAILPPRFEILYLPGAPGPIGVIASGLAVTARAETPHAG